jgi:hypothetical protein
MQMVMADARNPTVSKRSGRVFGLLGILIPACLFVALKQLHEPKFRFRFVSIASQSPEEPGATLAKISQADSALIRRAHIEIIVLTLFALILLSCLFNQSGIPKWTKFLLVTTAAASVAACWLQW